MEPAAANANRRGKLVTTKAWCVRFHGPIGGRATQAQTFMDNFWLNFMSMLNLKFKYAQCGTRWIVAFPALQLSEILLVCMFCALRFSVQNQAALSVSTYFHFPPEPTT